MPTYYVSDTGGDDARSTTTAQTIGTPWKTVLKAVQNVAAGDTVHIAPGTYRESSGLALVTAGSSGSIIRFRGDPNLVNSGWPSGVQPGIVRLTRTDTNNLPTSGNLLDLSTYGYNEFWDFYLDGCTVAATNRLVQGSTSTAGQRFIRCFGFGGYHGFYAVHAIDCVAISKYSAFYECRSASNGSMLRCAGLSNGRTMTYCEGDNCFAMSTAAESAWRYGIPRHCVIVGGNPAFYSLSDGNGNNFSLMPVSFVSTSTTYNPQNSLFAIATSDAPAGTHDLSTCRQIYVTTEQATTLAEDGHQFNFIPPVEFVRNLMRCFTPMVFDDEDMATLSITGLDEDAHGKAHNVRWRGQTADKRYPGALALPDAEGIESSGRRYKIYKTGQQVLHIPIKANTATTISISCAYNLDSGTGYPAIELEYMLQGSDAWVSADTDAITSGDSSPHTLEVSVNNSTITNDTIARLILKATGTETNCYAEFYGLAVT